MVEYSWNRNASTWATSTWGTANQPIFTFQYSSGRENPQVYCATCDITLPKRDEIEHADLHAEATLKPHP